MAYQGGLPGWPIHTCAEELSIPFVSGPHAQELEPIEFFRVLEIFRVPHVGIPDNKLLSFSNESTIREVHVSSGLPAKSC